MGINDLGFLLCNFIQLLMFGIFNNSLKLLTEVKQLIKLSKDSKYY